MRKFMLVFGVLLAIGFVVACGKKEEKPVVLNAVPTINNQMPALNIVKTDNTPLFMKDLDGKVCVIFFNPDCDHCQREAQMLQANKDILKDYQVYFITIDQMPAIIEFADKYKLSSESNVVFARAEPGEVINAVGQINQVPTFFIYRDRALVTRMEGEVTLEKLKSVL